jgi:alkylhydroperoxidase/carboxymuconolactone decarboxylase family protein YurZ
LGTELIDTFREYHEQMNEKLLGLINSMVLGCDDCVKYQLDKCYLQRVASDEIMEIFAIANLPGGTIVIPNTRKAMEYLEALEKTCRG